MARRQPAKPAAGTTTVLTEHWQGRVRVRPPARPASPQRTKPKGPGATPVSAHPPFVARASTGPLQHGPLAWGQPRDPQPPASVPLRHEARAMPGGHHEHHGGTGMGPAPDERREVVDVGGGEQARHFGHALNDWIVSEDPAKRGSRPAHADAAADGARQSEPHDRGCAHRAPGRHPQQAPSHPRKHPPPVKDAV